MRYRGFVASVLMMALILCGCQSGETSAARKIADCYKRAESWQANVAVTVDLGEQTAEFLLGWDVGEEGSTITVLKPSEIAGICVGVSKDGQEIVYDEQVIALPRTDGTTAPMPTEALCVLYEYWRYGIQNSFAVEKQGDREVVSIDYVSGGDDNVEVQTTFDILTMYPITSEVYYDGERIIQCEFETFAFDKTN